MISQPLRGYELQAKTRRELEAPGQQHLGHYRRIQGEFVPVP
jgi:hypothetical protein